LLGAQHRGNLFDNQRSQLQNCPCCNIGQNCVIGPDVTIGNKCKIQNNLSVYKGVTLEDGVFCGPSMVFTNIYNPAPRSPRWTRSAPAYLLKNKET
jgi:UDP-2-acetamido-3-amino-2,3-dideoxy-glucuronate N-acetyltransferase